MVASAKHKPITYTAMKPQINAIADKLKLDRVTEQINEHYDTLESKGVRVPLGDERLKAGRNLDLENAGMYDTELAAVAPALAYYDLAASHLIDSIAKELEYGLTSEMQGGLHDALRTASRATDEAHCVQLLAEEPERERERVKLQEEKERLLVALERVKSLPQGAGL